MMNFPIMSPEQIGLLNSLQQGRQLGTIPLQQQMQNLQNQQLRAQLPYAGGLAQAQMGQAQAQIPLTQAQTALTEAQIPYLGLKYYAPMLTAQAHLAQVGLGASKAVQEFMNSPNGQQLMKDNPEVGQLLINATQNQGQLVNSGFGLGMPNVPGFSNNQNIPQYASNGQPLMSNGQQAPNEGLPAQGLPLQPSQVQKLQQLIANPQSVQNLQGLAGSEVANKLFTPQQRQMQVYSQSFDKQITPWINQLPQFANYAGLAGRSGMTLDKYLASSFGTNSPEFNKWNAWVTTGLPLAMTDLRRTLGGHATNQQINEMQELGDPALWKENPAGALSRFNALLSAKKANDQVIFTPSGQILQQGQEQAKNPPVQYATTPGTGVKLPSGVYHVLDQNGKSNIFSDEDINSTAKKYNMTPEEVKQKLGIK